VNINALIYGGSNDIEWVHRGDNLKRGVLTMWNKQIFKCSKIEEGKDFLLIVGEYKIEREGLGIEAAIINVYGPCLNAEKFTLWKEIEKIKLMQGCSVWCIQRDFNFVKSKEE